MMDFTTYQSPFTWRYGSEDMRSLWSEGTKRRLWRKIWVALATAESEFGLVTSEQVEELKSREGDIDIPAAMQIEAEIHHDLMAELKTFANQCPNAGGILHLGATSMDIEDNAEAIRIRMGCDHILRELDVLLVTLARKIDAYADLPVMAYTHIQPAEPSTLGYRFSVYAQDLLADRELLLQVRSSFCGKGMKGAVGTGASYCDLIGCDQFDHFEKRLSELLDLPFSAVSTQTYSRKQEYTLISTLSGLGATLSKLSLDIRILQSPPFGEISEPFGEKQVGSSAMPFKRNPIQSEKIDSLARQLMSFPMIAWQNASSSILERTLDDSANRRTILPEAFLICDEMLTTENHIVSHIHVRPESIRRNLNQYAPFAITERVLMAAVQNGGDRQELHEILRQHALAAWGKVEQGESNDLIQRMKQDSRITCWISQTEIESLCRVEEYTGIAPTRARALAARILSWI